METSISSNLYNNYATNTNLNNYESYIYSFASSLSGNLYKNYLTSANLNNYLLTTGGTMTGLINFNTSMTLSTTYTGCRVSLWYDGTSWYGFGVNGNQLIYNVPRSASRIFQCT